jgi:carboxyl-terminal processing protease
MNKIFLILSLTLIAAPGFAKNTPDHSHDWKEKPAEAFLDAEATFKLTQQKILEKYVDKTITKDELYRAATAGMLASLNRGTETWNELLSPQDMKEMQIDLSGKVTGIGVEMNFDERTGYALVQRLIPDSVAEKAGLKMDDQILSVDGKKFKGKKFRDMVVAVRGEVGKTVALKILREDKIIDFKLKRAMIPWTPVELENISDSTALLSIRLFNDATPRIVEEKINEINAKKYTKLIVDVRDNSGGGFEQALKVTELFLPKDSVIGSTKDRNGKIESFKSTKGLLNPQTQVILITNKDTFCGAELFTAALKEIKKVKIVGETTFGKWNAQIVEMLPNKYALKYTVKEFQSPLGRSYQGIGIKPDMEVALPEGSDSNTMRVRYELKKRLDKDVQLKAAVELSQSII